MLAWTVDLFEQRRRPHAYEIALLIFLAAQLVIVDRPYKQYYGPWFLVASCFVPCIGVLAGRLSARGASWCLGIAIVIAGWTALVALQTFARRDQAHEMLGFYNTMLRLSPGEQPIVAFPPLHPVVRRDVFYGWSRTTDPGGAGTEVVMGKLDVPGYSERFERAHYQQELDAHPPALVVVPLDTESAYEPGQWSVLREYVAAHQDRYVLVTRDLLRPVWVRQGPP
jgi:hypothetical protein